MAITYATLNPSDKSTNITLSGGNLVCTKGGADTVWSSVRSDIAVSSGKWYWEITVTNSGAGKLNMIGIATSAPVITNYLSADAQGWQYYGEAGKKVNNTTQTTYGATFTTGDVIGVALDMDAGTLEFFKNNTSQGVAFTGLSGTMYAGLSTFINGDVMTCNFGATAFTYTPPSGYNAGLYAGSVNTLVVAGGGGAGSGGGGGGAGGYQANTALTVTPQAYTITVGGGGAGGSAGVSGSTGSNSVFSTITANGGGAGGGVNSNGGNGGSGGGSGGTASGLTGGSATQGFAGGNSSGSASPYPSGGGGGSSAVGANNTPNTVSGAGGAGTANSISGSSVTYAGGGGGWAANTGGSGGAGGAGGGGAGGDTGTAGTANTGGGGGGSIQANTGAAGGSGVVIIAFPTDGSTGVSTSSTGGTITTVGGNQIHTFTTSGTWTMVAYTASNNGAGFFMMMQR